LYLDILGVELNIIKVMYLLVDSGSKANTDSADTLRSSFAKINANFLELSGSLNFDQTPIGSAGSSAGYIIIKINGTNYKIPIYNV
jgi:hypothetical protein